MTLLWWFAEDPKIKYEQRTSVYLSFEMIKNSNKFVEIANMGGFAMLKLYMDKMIMTANYLDEYPLVSNYPMTRVTGKLTFRKSLMYMNVFQDNKSSKTGIIANRFSQQSANVTESVDLAFKTTYNGNISDINYSAYNGSSGIPSDFNRGYVFLDSCYDPLFSGPANDTSYYGKVCYDESYDNYNEYNDTEYINMTTTDTFNK